MYYHLRNTRRHFATPTDVNFFSKILRLAGDIALSPGPPKYPCGTCKKAVESNRRALQCDRCESWNNINCADVSPIQYRILGLSDDPWFCNKCPQTQHFYFNGSFFSKRI